MHALSENQLLLVLVALGVILLCGRAAGEVARRVHQPEVLGQLVAGFVLGPSVLGALAPLIYRTLFSEPAVGNGLSLFSWAGAILLLLLAGMEVDPAILRIQLKTGALTAAGAIGASLVAGTLFAWLVLGQPPQSGIFLGIVLSVTAVTVTSTILLERGVMRRSYAQVMLVAGVSSEVLVWVFVSVISSAQGSSPLLAAAESVVSALGVFLFMLTFGRRFTFWAMRRVTDATHITRGPISFVLVLTFLVGALTHAMRLHPLLGAFIVGVLLRGAPRVSPPLAQSMQTMTLGLFGPVFFVLAGMRVDLTQPSGPSAIITIVLLLVVASLVKIGFGGLGALGRIELVGSRVGGRRIELEGRHGRDRRGRRLRVGLSLEQSIHHVRRGGHAHRAHLTAAPHVARKEGAAVDGRGGAAGAGRGGGARLLATGRARADAGRAAAVPRARRRRRGVHRHDQTGTQPGLRRDAA